ncbi:unnamed protein product [Diatraea saccharalis]|uniref:Alcohol dehydrogenase n=1 Tax=Diatraea saccharalis TaxID=40085 RepID=A0A9N9WKN9_9NEOP|nr:unnamed protein product [Diatraea saccharalis]
MEKDLKNKIVVVTGASRGIGLSIVEAFLLEQVKKAIILDINSDAGINTTKQLNSKFGEGKVDFFQCDISVDVDTVFDKIVQKYKTIDILVNNAGTVNENSIRQTMNVNVVGTVDLTMKFWNYARKDKGGSGGTVINIASVSGFRVDPFSPFYKASKYAVIGFTRTIGHTVNYQQTAVRVIGICPGYTKTNMGNNISLHESRIFHAPILEKFKKKAIWQEVDAVSKAAVEIFKKADSGTMWLIEGGVLNELLVPSEWISEV